MKLKYGAATRWSATAMVATAMLLSETTTLDAQLEGIVLIDETGVNAGGLTPGDQGPSTLQRPTCHSTSTAL